MGSVPAKDMEAGWAAKGSDIGARQPDIPIDQPDVISTTRPGLEADRPGAAEEVEEAGMPDQPAMIQNIEKGFPRTLAGGPDGSI